MENEGRAKEFEWVIPAVHKERSNDWFWAMGLITLAGAGLAFWTGNMLFGVFILLAGGLLFYTNTRPPNDVHVHVEERGLIVDGLRYPAKRMRGFAITKTSDERDVLIVRTSRAFLPMLMLEIPDDISLEDLADTLAVNIPSADLREPSVSALATRLGL